MAKFIVQDGKLYRIDAAGDRAVVCRIPRSPREKTGWRSWLADSKHTAFEFRGNNGSFHATRQPRKSTGSNASHDYWYCDKTTDGHRRRRCLGPARPLTTASAPPTLAKLERIAAELNQATLPGDAAAEIAQRRGRQKWVGRVAPTAPGPGPRPAVKPSPAPGPAQPALFEPEAEPSYYRD